MEEHQSSEWQQARASLYGLFGDLLSRRPDKHTLDRLMCFESVDYVETLFVDQPAGDRFRRAVAQYKDGEIDAEQIILDFESLMRVPGPNYTHPYESSYRTRIKDEKGPSWGGVSGEQAREAEHLFKSEGLKPRYEIIDYADHIGAELTFMAHLCDMAAEALNASDRNAAAFMIEKQRLFAVEHLFTWVDDFCSQLKTRAATSFYRVISELLCAFAAMEKSELLDTDGSQYLIY